MREFIIGKNDADQRVDKFLLKTFPELKKGIMCKAVRTKNIKLNGKRCDISDHLKEGDVLKVFIKDDLLGKEKKTGNKEKEFSSSKKLEDDEIIYEDENIILVNKKPGVIVHSDDKITGDTLVDRIRKHLYDNSEYDPENENSFAPAICNRLDRNTAGIVVAAKNAAALREMNRRIRENLITKKYLCLTSAMPPQKEATITAYHCKDSKSNTVKIRSTAADGYKQIITRYKVLEKCEKAVLVEVELITGRTHQIRAHMAFIGAPVIGDRKYGIKKVNDEHDLKYQALCAYKIKFDRCEDENVLSYLDSKEFQTMNVWFLEKYF